MGCCLSRPDDDDDEYSDRPQYGRGGGPPPVRHHPHQDITSQTAINGPSPSQHDTTTAHVGSGAAAAPSGLSLQASATSRSALSTPRPSSSVHSPRRSRQQENEPPPPLSDHYNLPLQPAKPWSSRNPNKAGGAGVASTTSRKTWTRAQLERERDEFFETRVTGRGEIWDGLRQVVECLREGDLADAQGILDALAVTLPTGRLEEGAYDEAGNLYRMPEVVISDPTDVVDENTPDDPAGDVDGPTVVTDDVLAAKLEATTTSVAKEEPPPARTKEAKGKAAMDKDAIKVRCRLSDRGGPDVVVLLGRRQRVGTLAPRIRDETEIPPKAGIRIAYLGRILDDNLPLVEQGWKEGHVLNALVVGRLGN